MLVTGIFYFSDVFNRFFLMVSKTQHCVLTFSQNKSWFLRVCGKSLLKTLWEKEKLLVTGTFFLFPLCFQPCYITACHFPQIEYCCLRTLSVWKSLKFVVWERVKGLNCPINQSFTCLIRSQAVDE